MSKQIDLEKKLSDEDRAYLLARGRRWQVIQNDRRFASTTAAPQQSSNDGESDEWEAEVKELTVDELRDELANRGLSTSGNKPELQKRLIAAGPEE